METNAGIEMFSAEDGQQISAAEASGIVLLLVAKQPKTII